MLQAGLHVDDAAMFLAITYLIWGGWLLTGAGLVACWKLIQFPDTRQRGVELFAGSLAPLIHIGVWALVARLPAAAVDLTVPGVLLLVGLHGLIILAAPLVALRELRSRPPRRRRTQRRPLHGWATGLA